MFASLMANGISALRAEDYPTAQAAFEKAVAVRPADVEARYLLGRAYGLDKKYQFAAQQFRETLKLSPAHAQALVDLGTIEVSMGRFDDAFAHFTQALKNGPNPPADRGLASLLSKQGKLDEATVVLRKALAASADDVETRYQLGLALTQEGNCAAAIPEFRAVIQRVSAHLGALFNLGNCLNRTGARDEAERTLGAFQKASQDEATRVDRRRRAHFLSLEADRRLEAGDAAGALEAMQEAVSLNPGDAGLNAMLAQAFEASGDTPRALASYLKAAELDPRDAMVMVETGRLMGRVGRFVDALPYLKRAAQIDPLMPDPHLLMSALYQKLGHPAEAAQEEALYRKLAATARQPDPR